jgi:hypothetical protein
MLESCYISLRPIRWSQEIRWYPSINVEGRHLRATCTTTDDLLLSDGQKLRDFEIELSIMDGELDPETRAKSKLQEAAIGGIWWISDHPSLVHGRFYLKSDARAAIWDQVRAGGYVDCRITLSVTPVRLKASSFAMDGNPLSVESADVQFTRRPIAEKPANPVERKAALDRRRWAVVLLSVSGIAWLFPTWNGIFVGSSQMTTGEGRIIATLLFVAGLLLWFLDRPRPSKDQ